MATSTSTRRLILGLSFMMTLGGCSILASSDAETEGLEAKLERLKNKYARKTKDIKQDTKKKKKAIQKALKKQDLAQAIALIDDLYSFTNPCGEDRCTSDQSSYIYGRDYIFEEEDIDREEDFIEDSMDDAIKMAKKALKAGEYGRLELALAKADKQWKHDTDKQETLVELRDNLQQSWLKSMSKRADSHSKTYPGVALLQYAKANELAQAQGNRKASVELARKFGVLRARLLQDNTFDLQLTGANGQVAEQVSSIMLSTKRKKLIRIVRRATSTTDGTLSLQTTQPSFRLTDTSASGSFKYANGTRQEKNPEYDVLRKKEKYFSYLSSHCGAECSDGTCAYYTYSGWTGSGETKMSHEACSVARSARSSMESYRSQAVSLGPNKTVTNYDKRSYPYTVHNHRAVADLSMVLSLKGRRPNKTSASFDAVLKDKSHPAFSHGGGGVSQDPKRVPSAQAVQKELAKNISMAVEKVIDKTFDIRLNSLLKEGDSESKKGRLQRINAMVVYTLISPYKATKSFETELKEFSGIPNAMNLLGSKTSSKKGRRSRRRN